MDLLELPVLSADHRIPYGRLPVQFGDLWLPHTAGNALLPLIVFFHGGWWKSEYDLGYAGYFCRALNQEGFAVWSVEYRRLGATGGGWPATFQDASSGFEFIQTLAKRYPLDLERVITTGHSAGGHLALWIAGRAHVPPQSALLPTAPGVHPIGAVSLAGAVDLRAAIQMSGTPGFAHVRDRVQNFMGGSPTDQPGRYRAGDPGELRPLICPQILVQGTNDNEIPPELPVYWSRTASSIGDVAEAKIVPGAGHFDVVDPRSNAWPVVVAAAKSLGRFQRA